MKEKCMQAWKQILAVLGPSFEVTPSSELAGMRIFPRRFHDVHAGDELIWFSFLEDNGGQSVQDSIKLIEKKGERTVEERVYDFSDLRTAVVPQFAPLLNREAAASMIRYLEDQSKRMKTSEETAVLKAKILELSVAHRVLCSLTALLVLETEDDYIRYNITRSALADILAVGSSGIETIQRQISVPVTVNRPPSGGGRPPSGGSWSTSTSSSSSHGGSAPGGYESSPYDYEGYGIASSASAYDGDGGGYGGSSSGGYGGSSGSSGGYGGSSSGGYGGSSGGSYGGSSGGTSGSGGGNYGGYDGYVGSHSTSSHHSASSSSGSSSTGSGSSGSGSSGASSTSAGGGSGGVHTTLRPTADGSL
jgi:hypothetical protein